LVFLGRGGASGGLPPHVCPPQILADGFECMQKLERRFTEVTSLGADLGADDGGLQKKEA
jgi:hypothetical protein